MPLSLSWPLQVYEPVTSTTSFYDQGNTFAADPAAALGAATVDSINQATGVNMASATVPSGFTGARVVSVRLWMSHARVCHNVFSESTAGQCSMYVTSDCQDGLHLSALGPAHSVVPPTVSAGACSLAAALLDAMVTILWHAWCSNQNLLLVLWVQGCHL
jgi:hypothetical protein